jgi:hypothetical protein
MKETSSNPRSRVFISYCDRDAGYLSRLKIHLELYVREGIVDIWDDTKLEPGSNWREEIRQAIASAEIAVLLVSADFLASAFITGQELPPLLAAAKQEGAIILTVILSPCLFDDTELAQFQTVNKPSTPLSTMNKSRREETWVRVAKLIKQIRERQHQVAASDDLPQSPIEVLTAQQTHIILEKTLDNSRATGDVAEKSQHQTVGKNSMRTRGEERSHQSPEDPTRNLQSLSLKKKHKVAPAIRIMVIVVIVIAIIASTFLVIRNKSTPSGTLVVNDSLNQANNWKDHLYNTTSDKGSCTFLGRAYHALASTPGYKVKCPGPSTEFSNFDFQVQMTIIKGDCGGIFFRADLNTQKYYYFHVCQDGSYTFFLYNSEDNPNHLLNSTSEKIHKGLNKPNLIEVKAQGSNIDLYVNKNHIGATVSDTTYSNGQIGVVAAANDSPSGTPETEAVFSDAMVWTL